TSDTIGQLMDKLDLLQTTQEQMKAVNKLLKGKNTKTLSLKEKITILVKEGFPKDIITRIEESVNGDLHKIPSFYLTNNNANMKRIKDRIAAEEKRQKKYQDGNKTTVFDGLRIVENVEENQLQLLFDEKPSEEIRTILKKEGRFRWSRKNRVWQRQLTNNAIYCLKHILKDIVKKKVKTTVKPRTARKKKTRNIVVKLPVTLQTINKHLKGKELKNSNVLGKMSTKEFLIVWKYVLAGNKMLEKKIYPTSSSSDSSNLLMLAGHRVTDEIRKEFLMRDLHHLYTISFETKKAYQKEVKTSTIKLPVSLTGIKKHLLDKPVTYFEKLSELSEAEFLIVWKYVLATNEMANKLLYPSKLTASYKKLIKNINLKSIVKQVNKEFSKRNWELIHKLQFDVKLEEVLSIKQKEQESKAITKLHHLKSLASRAWYGISHKYTQRAKDWMSYREGQLITDIRRMRNAEKDIDLDRYIEKYINFCNEELTAHSNCLSPMIAGPSKFPIRKAQKANERLDKKQRAFIDWRKKMLDFSELKYSQAIRGGELDSLQKLQKKLVALEQYQEKLKLVNKILRNKKIEDKKAEFAKQGINEEMIRNIRPYPIIEGSRMPSFYLSNNNAVIRNVKKRIEKEKSSQGRYKDGNKTIEYRGLKVVHNVEENRLQLFFDRKPSEVVRTILKQKGAFKWAPNEEAWQRQLTDNAVSALERILKDILPT
ncbi:MAG: hypothetical protein ACRBFS_23860, partial [Aureispira sp.]